MTLKEYIENTGISLADFARLVPCSYNYPGMIINGRAKPSYRMATRIESVTAGLVPRTNWYPAPAELPDVEVDING